MIPRIKRRGDAVAKPPQGWLTSLLILFVMNDSAVRFSHQMKQQSSFPPIHSQVVQTALPPRPPGTPP